MTRDEKLRLVFGYAAMEFKSKHYFPPKQAHLNSAGFVYGIDRVGVPPEWQTDAGIGVSSLERTALPSGLAMAASWNPELALAGGEMIGNEARLSGFNVQLAGGVNLIRDPRNGRNFEYAGEDPLLAGTMVGQAIRGIQSNSILSTMKHFALNDQETNRGTIDVRIGEKAARMSDLLAFEFAFRIGDPSAVMCSYNRVNGVYACENDWLLNQVLKKDWGFKGYVMSDWGGAHSTLAAAQAGLDQESGFPFDDSTYFGDALKEAVIAHQLPERRLDDMAYRILFELYDKGVMDHPVSGDESAKIDFKAHAQVSQRAAEEAFVLLKNQSELLPLTKNIPSIALIGGHADVGVLSGGGSSQVTPIGGSPVPNEGPQGWPGPILYDPSSAMKALGALLPAKMTFNDGKDIEAAAKLAAESNVVIVFATQWMTESVDASNLLLPGQQNELIKRVARANKKTVLVLETGGPVEMPWLNEVGAILETWYPGSSGGSAIARVLAGAVNPSGHLPLTFPSSERQLPRVKLDGDARNDKAAASVNYNIEGAAVGYKWFDLKNQKPLFPFGWGLSYTHFDYKNLHVFEKAGEWLASFLVENTGTCSGKATPQIYLSSRNGDWEAPKRLGGWSKIELAPNENQLVQIKLNPRLFAVFNEASKTWMISEGDYEVFLMRSATEPVERSSIHLQASVLGE